MPETMLNQPKAKSRWRPLAIAAAVLVPTSISAECSDCAPAASNHKIAWNCPTCVEFTGVGECHYLTTIIQCQYWPIASPQLRTTVNSPQCTRLTECNSSTNDVWAWPPWLPQKQVLPPDE